MIGQPAPPPARVQPLNEIFRRGVAAVWATTYNVDLALFNEFLLGRLGEPPLNVVVLADHKRLALSLDRVPAERVPALAAVNRRWLLRSVRPGGQAFHPKSYLAVSPSGTTLLVGSGNLSAPGLDSGKEVFTTFRSGNADGDAAIAAWAGWVRRLVESTADTALAERFAYLSKRLPPAVTAPGPLLHNLDAPIGAQLAGAVAARGAGPVDELLLTAPFYDDDAAAVESLLDALRPAAVRVYVTATTSVNGPALAATLAASGADARVHAYEPDEFVHAKLLGVVAGDQGWLLSGSANLSRAALTTTSALTGGHGNVELAALAVLTPDQVRAAFTPPGMTARERDAALLAPLTVRHDPDPAVPSIRLLSAAASPDGRVRVRADRPPEPGWHLDDLSTARPLVPGDDGTSLTDGPIQGRLVRLADAHGEPLSNQVVVDDPDALRAALTGSNRDPSERPPELAGDDAGGPLGRGLLWLHRRLVMDVSEPAAAGGTGQSPADDAERDGDDDLWERLEREQLARDPRSYTYSRMWRADGAGDPIIELLEALRDRVPADLTRAAGGRSVLDELLARRRAKAAADGPEDGPSEGGDPGSRRRWKPATRTRVRALNVLRRWAAAQHDPRLVWVDPLAPAGNLAAVTAFLAGLRLDSAAAPGTVELTDADMDDVWSRWLRPIAGTGQGDGWLDGLTSAEGAAARQAMPQWLPEASAALTWLLIRPGPDRRSRVVAFQPVLTAALGHGLIQPTDLTASYLSAVTGQQVRRDRIDEDLLVAESFVDDHLWCARTAEELGVARLRLEASPGAGAVRVRLFVTGIADPMLDPRLPRLLSAVRQYRRGAGVALFDADGGWRRLALVEGAPATYLPARGAPDLQSFRPVDDAALSVLAAQGQVLADVFPNPARVA